MTIAALKIYIRGSPNYIIVGNFMLSFPIPLLCYSLYLFYFISCTRSLYVPSKLQTHPLYITVFRFTKDTLTLRIHPCFDVKTLKIKN